MADNDVQIQIALALADIIKATKPKARVWPYWILTQGLGESIPDLSSPNENEWGAMYPKWVHAYMIDFDGFPRQALGVGKFLDTYDFDLWGFYGWYKGDLNHNSHFVFSKHVKDIQNALSQATKLQHGGNALTIPPIPPLPDGVGPVKGHEQWQPGKIGTYWFGKDRVHVAQGTISVSANILLNPTPIG